MYMLCSASASASPMSAATPASSGRYENFSNVGSRSCIAWPILLMLSSFDVRGRPSVVEGLLLEEAPHPGTRCQELAVADPLLLAWS